MEKPHEMKTSQISPKQGVAIGVLSLVLLSVGIWQWQSMGGRKASPQATNTAQPANTPTASASSLASQTVMGASLAPFPARDPFRPTVGVEGKSLSRVASPANTSSKPARREITGTPPMPPLALPAPGGLEVRRVDEPELPAMPNWTLVGVVQGPRTVAILKDSEGNRHFVQIGDTLEEGWRVRRIERGRLILQKGQRTISVDVGSSTTEGEALSSQPSIPSIGREPVNRSTGGIQR